MEYTPDTDDGIFHSGNPLAGSRGTPVESDFFNELLKSVPAYFDRDASAGLVEFHLSGARIISVKKVDATPNPVRIIAPLGFTVLRQSYVDLTLQDDFITVRLSGTDYGRG